MDGPYDGAGQARNEQRRRRQGSAQGAGVRLRERARRFWLAVRAWPRPRAARAPADKPAELAQAAGRDKGRDGVRAGDLLPGERRIFRRPYRRGIGGHARRMQSDYAVPGAGIAYCESILVCPLINKLITGAGLTTLTLAA